MNTPAECIEEAERARREGRLDDAWRAHAEAAALSRAAGARRSLIHALKGLGQIERDRGNPDPALAAYQEAATLAREECDSCLLAHTIRHVGDVLRHLGRLTDAEASYTEALALYRGTPDAPPLDVANAIRAMAVLRDEQGACGDALPLWEKACAIYASLGVQAGVAEAKARMTRSRAGSGSDQPRRG